uniref:Uncharacterized protein n=1 Tax=Cacopsylla melanoneura TaxID=428564 RepID=A0A8D8YEB8_9HEMI
MSIQRISNSLSCYFFVCMNDYFFQMLLQLLEKIRLLHVQCSLHSLWSFQNCKAWYSIRRSSFQQLCLHQVVLYEDEPEIFHYLLHYLLRPYFELLWLMSLSKLFSSSWMVAHEFVFLLLLVC